MWFKKAFRQGEHSGAYNLALMCRDEGDYQNAVSWFKKSIDADSQFQLGLHNYWGIGVRKDYEAAIRAFRKAVRAKYITEAERDDAFFYLAIAHLEGKGARPSSQKAVELLKRANIDNDHPAARSLLQAH